MIESMTIIIDKMLCPFEIKKIFMLVTIMTIPYTYFYNKNILIFFKKSIVTIFPVDQKLSVYPSFKAKVFYSRLKNEKCVISRACMHPTNIPLNQNVNLFNKRLLIPCEF
jgi:hypothetical protein